MCCRQRHVCNNMLAGSDEQGMEMCIHAATNVSCRTEHQVREEEWEEFEMRTRVE